MILYILKFSACLAVFMLFYKLFLEKESFHQFKRGYLLGTLIISAIIPLITFTTYVEVSPMEIIDYNSEIGTPSIVPDLLFEEPTNYWPKILWSVYGIGVLVFTIRFGMNLSNILKRIKHNPKFKNHSFIYVLLNDLVHPHTFLNYIFFNKTKYEAQEIPKEVLLHEETHAREKHALDILFIEVFQIVFWFNPLLYFIKKDIKLNHEFLADQAVINHGFELKNYQNTLLAFSSNAQEPQLVNAINYSSIKKRFTVMKTHTSKHIIWVRSLVVLPLLALLIYSFSNEKEVIKESNKLNNFTITIEKDNGEVKLQCLEGCAWKELTFKDTQNNSNVIDFYGVSSENSDEDSDFAFIVESKNNGVNLKSLKGTAWTDLSFTLPSNTKQAIDRNGMVTLKTSNNTELHTIEKELVILIYFDKVSINGNLSSVDNFIRDLNSITNEWNEEDYLSIIPNINIQKNSNEFLKDLNNVFKETDFYLKSKYGSNVHLINIPVIKVTTEPFTLKLNSAETSLEDLENDFNTLIRNQKSSAFLESNDEISIELLHKIANNMGSNLIDLSVAVGKTKVVGEYNKQQKGASKAQIAEYNKLAKHINSQSKDNPIIKIKDLERLKYLYDLMTEEQRKSAEPFPNIPLPPPPPPPAPENSNAKPVKRDKKFVQEYAKAHPENVKTRITKSGEVVTSVGIPEDQTGKTTYKGETYFYQIKNGETTYWDRYGNKVDVSKIEPPEPPSIPENVEIIEVPAPPPPVPANATPEQKKEYKKWREEYYKKYKVENGKVSEREPSPPTPPKPKSEVAEPKSKNPWGITTTVQELPDNKKGNKTPPIPSEHMKQLSEKNAVFFYNKKNISGKEAIKLTSENHNLHINVSNENSNQPRVEISDRKSNIETPEIVEVPPPPPPPKSPLDHVIDMAKKGATFYYEDKKISSDKAIQILKTDKSMNISSKNSDSKNPKVYLSKEPIKIKNK